MIRIIKRDQALPCSVHNRRRVALLPDLVRERNSRDMDRSIKAHLNILFHSKTGKLMQEEECSKSFDEQVISRLNGAIKVNSELEYLNDKHDQ